MAKRRPGRLFPLEFDILECGLVLQLRDGTFYGFALARELADRDGAGLTAHGTLYKALSRMKDSGLLAADWEDADSAEVENRPRRRLYRVTGEGELALRAERALLAAERLAVGRGAASPGLTPRPAGAVTT
ncbi:PadR family transcriptional regulator [Herbiconiux liukaitaii]|uniref:PadR family transcriptional regulator n=1 Tax=Herbiconiux liukaitaii TaxID=3342799 RepID=UPI0035B85CD0